MFIAPALTARLKRPLTFAQIEASLGWIVHGQPGNYWNEHVNAALALWCTKEAFDQIRAFAEVKRGNPGVYDLFSYNCLTFVIEALAQGAISLEVGSSKRLRTFIPRNAFRRVSQVTGAHKLGAWKTGLLLPGHQKMNSEQSPIRLTRLTLCLLAE